MTIQMINVGRLANDGTGDDLREAFIKVNQNFQLFENLADFRARNLGSAGAEVFSDITEGEMRFRRLVAGDNIQLNQFDNSIEISSQDAPSTNFQIVGDNSNSLTVNDQMILFLLGDGNIITKTDENTKTVNFKIRENIAKYFSYDFGEFEQNQTSILEFVMNTIGVDLGTFDTPNQLTIDLGIIE